ncbi:hypothetical protein HPB48_011651 [Haemaphysalis longicornis]|uniref:Carboxylesterase type B domain-containing protein n=1 Tax=Haemaphysalis longicornis TaxID=44386 RepID=A0A9J6G538_HAELO|nr:hypothetical protein HPB48_011651 [Haemaphysalis longicornis]
MFVALVVVYKNRQERPAYVVQTRDSQIEGRPVQVEGVQVVEFLGIPFAESTAGSNRFRKPVPRTLRSKFVAHRWGRPCPQRNDARLASSVRGGGSVQATTADHRRTVSKGRSFEETAQSGTSASGSTDQHAGGGGIAEEEGHETPSEDCLHLNIWVPRMQASNISSGPDSGDPSERAPKKPVMVFFHGGGFQEGSNSDPRYDGRYLSALGGIVVVVPNYRVGPLAFIGSDGSSDEEPGNLALIDQRMALDWVRAYIDDFEGDTTAIVAAGVGAGASSLALHLLSPEGQHSLTDVKRFVLHSGSPVGPYADQRAAQQVLMGNVANEGLQALAAFKKNLPEGVVPDKAVHQFLPRELSKYGVHNAAELIRMYLNDEADAPRQLSRSVYVMRGLSVSTVGSCQEADISPGPFLMTTERVRAANPTFPWAYEDMVIFAGRPLRFAKNVFGFLKAFSGPVWAATASTLFATWLAFVAVRAKNPSEGAWTTRLSSSFGTLVRPLLSQGAEHLPDATLPRALVTVWFLGIIVLRTSFLGEMKAALVVRADVTSIRGMEDVAKDDRVTPIVLRSSGFYTVLKVAHRLLQNLPYE